MPRYVRPTLLPNEAERVVEAFGNRVRLSMLKALAEGEADTLEGLVSHLGVATMTAHRHLLALEDLGLVTADIPKASRQGRQVHYRADNAAIQRAVDDLRAYLNPKG